MNILDENITESQRQLLRSWRIATRQIGHEVGRQGIKDDEIIPLLHSLRRPAFFTRDLGFYDRHLSHSGYCLIVLAVGQYEVASFVRRFLKHPQFNTDAKRLGAVVAASHVGLRVWRLHAQTEMEVPWLP